MRHIGVLFTKNVFGDDSVKVTAKTVIAKTDTGEWTHLEEFKAYIKTSKDKQQAIVTHQTDTDWEDSISTKEFDNKTKVEAFGRIISRTTYHAEQMAIILKYGNV